MKKTDTEMTNRKGTIPLQYFKEMTKGIMGMYLTDTAECLWLNNETPYWERLAATLFDVWCFLKVKRREIRLCVTPCCICCGGCGKLYFPINHSTQFTVHYVQLQLQTTYTTIIPMAGRTNKETCSIQ